MKRLTFAILFIIPLVLTLVWFGHGNLMGGGESGLPFYDFNQMYKMYKGTWSDSLLGVPTLTLVSQKPTYWFLAQLQSFGINGNLIQAGFFFLSLIVSIFSSFFLYKEVFSKEDEKGALLASLFYIFNPAAMATIWNRFLYNAILFYSILPLGIFIFIRGIKRHSYKYVLYLSLFLTFFVYALAAPAQIIIFWGVILFVTIFYLFVGRVDFWWLSRYLLLLVGSWLVFNLWWISQFYSLYLLGNPLITASSNKFFNLQGNFSGLMALSSQQGYLGSLLNLKSRGFFETQNFPFNWPNFYNLWFVKAIQWLVTFLVFYVIATRRRVFGVLLFSSIFVFGIFASKGLSQPLGEIYRLVFSSLETFQVFRNPLEKFGLIISLGMAPLFGYSASFLIDHFKKRLAKNLLKISFLLYVFVILGFPFWTGLVFTGSDFPFNRAFIGFQVKVPGFYQSAKNWLTQRTSGQRLIVLPIGGEGVFYNWPKVYRGVELTNFLLGVSSISFNTTVPFYDRIVADLERIFFEYPNEFYKVAGMLNADTILLRKDVLFKESSLRDPQVVEEKIRSTSYLEKVYSDGALEFYGIDRDKTMPKIFLAHAKIESDFPQVEDFILSDSKQNDIVVSSGFSSGVEVPLRSRIIHPVNTFYFVDKPNYIYQKGSPIFPVYSVSPESNFYSWILLKEKVEMFLAVSQEEQVNILVSHLGKRLVEFREEVGRGNEKAASRSLLLYQKDFPPAIKYIRDLLSRGSSVDPVASRFGYIFGSHLKALEVDNMGDSLLKLVSQVRSEIKKEGEIINLFLNYDLIENDKFPINRRQVYKFQIFRQGSYELFIPDPVLTDFLAKFPNNIQVQIDNEVRELSFKRSNKGITLGEIQLGKGIHEIGFNLPEPKNLTGKNDTFSVVSDTKPETVSLKVQPFDPFSDYDVSFDYWIKSGSDFKLVIKEDIDPEVNGIVKPVFSKGFTTDAYWHDYSSFSTVFKPLSGANSIAFEFSALPWNDCKNFYGGEKGGPCDNPDIAKNFNRRTEVLIKNLVIKRHSTYPAILRQDFNNLSTFTEDSRIGFTKADSSTYKVNLQKVVPGSILVFSELYNPGWKLMLTDANGNGYDLPESKHIIVNGYANAWILDKKGEFEGKIVFSPQLNLEKFTSISLFSIGLVSLFLTTERIWVKVKN